MTKHPIALGIRAPAIAAVAVFAVTAALLITAPPAAAAGRTSVMAEGAGMGAQPSAAVRTVQRELQRLGYDVGPPGVDGRFGPLTAKAVRRLQSNQRLVVDGIVGQHTRKVLGRTRDAVAHTDTRTDTGQRQNVAHETSRNATTRQHRTSRTTATVPAARNAAMELAYTSTRWLSSLLAGVLGAVLALVSTVAVGAARRRRARTTDSELRWRREAPAATSGEHLRWQDPMDRLNDDGGKPPRLAASAASTNGSASRLMAGTPVIGYVTVTDHADDRQSAAAIDAACQRNGWKLIEIVRDRENGRTLDRPGLGYAVQRIVDHHAKGLVVSDLQRLSSSIIDLGALMAWFRDADATFVAVDLGIDTSTSVGRHVASTLIALSERERERIADRTRSGLHGGRAKGRRTGRPAVSDRPELLQRIAAMRAANMTLQAIADELNADGIPTLRGGTRWRPSSIQAAVGYRRPGPRDHLPPVGIRGRP
jgi:DNA invertase Pin-like site-specific DNA recombinase/peptidoglycan hydrolase-like protein with peptidoglycan-binding domain